MLKSQVNELPAITISNDAGLLNERLSLVIGRLRKISETLFGPSPEAGNIKEDDRTPSLRNSVDELLQKMTTVEGEISNIERHVG